MCLMTVKVLITAIGEHIIADASQVEDSVSDQVIGYWVKNPRLISYRNTDGELVAGLAKYCTVASDTEFAFSSHYIVAVLEPKEEVLNTYNNVIYGNASSPADSEDGGENSSPD